MSCIHESVVPVELDDDVIQDGKAVRLRFWARDRETGELLQFGDDLWYLHGGYGGVFPKVELAVQGCVPGNRVQVLLDARDGYGEYDDDLILIQAKRSIPEEAWYPGTTITGQLPDGRQVPYTVMSVEDKTVTLDGNHPWAGKSLRFSFEVMEVRDSSGAERSAGYPFVLHSPNAEISLHRQP